MELDHTNARQFVVDDKIFESTKSNGSVVWFYSPLLPSEWEKDALVLLSLYILWFFYIIVNFIIQKLKLRLTFCNFSAIRSIERDLHGVQLHETHLEIIVKAIFNGITRHLLITKSVLDVINKQK